MNELYILLGAAVVTCITEVAKKYKADPMLVVGILSVLGGVVAVAYEYYVTEEIKALMLWAVPQVGAYSIALYEISKKFKK